ncbi:hypothetical protein D1159_05265 [Pseudoflavonifractor sp. 524-17]|nr:hypothetical protein [Pseudoflavonifractor sp. 524-17]
MESGRCSLGEGKRIGLVFAGGGGKGAYQIGVWKALRQLGLEEQVTAVSGTSVGALNAALFVQGDLERAVQVWTELTPTRVLRGNSPQMERLEELADLMGRCQGGICPKEIPAMLREMGPKLAELSVPPAALTLSGAWRALFRGGGALIPFARSALAAGAFSQGGLREIVDSALDGEKIARSAVHSYAACCKIPDLKPQYFPLWGESEERVAEILLASAALPMIFPLSRVGKGFYWDGGIPGVGDNVPVRPLAERESCNTIVAVHLSGERYVNPDQYPDLEIHNIIPSRDLGKVLTGTLDFSGTHARQRMELGEVDAYEALADW